MSSKPASSFADSAIASPLTWAALFGLVAACTACSTGTSCNTDELPPTDPCYQKGCCELITTDADGGVTDAGGPGTTSRMCGACNG